MGVYAWYQYYSPKYKLRTNKYSQIYTIDSSISFESCPAKHLFHIFCQSSPFGTQHTPGAVFTTIGHRASNTHLAPRIRTMPPSRRDVYLGRCYPPILKSSSLWTSVEYDSIIAIQILSSIFAMNNTPFWNLAFSKPSVWCVNSHGLEVRATEGNEEQLRFSFFINRYDGPVRTAVYSWCIYTMLLINVVLPPSKTPRITWSIPSSVLSDQEAKHQKISIRTVWVFSVDVWIQNNTYHSRSLYQDASVVTTWRFLQIIVLQIVLFTATNVIRSPPSSSPARPRSFEVFNAPRSHCFPNEKYGSVSRTSSYISLFDWPPLDGACYKWNVNYSTCIRVAISRNLTGYKNTPISFPFPPPPQKKHRPSCNRSMVGSRTAKKAIARQPQAREWLGQFPKP